MIAIIAGTGSLPRHACNYFAETNQAYFVISLFDENIAQIKEAAPTKIIQEPFYKAHKILNILKQEGTTRVLFIGKVDKQHLLKKFKLDWFAIKMLASLATKSDMSIMDKVASILKNHNIDIMHQHEVLRSLLVEPGVIAGTLTTQMQESITFGIEMTKKMAQCDVGQTVVVKDKMVLAVEAIEGTDACIQRGITLGKRNVIICKGTKDDHNKKFDIPTIGLQTIQHLHKGDVQAIAWISDKTFIADKEAFIQKARELGITLVSL